MSSSNTATLRCDVSNQAALRYIANQHIFQTWDSTVHEHELAGVSELTEHVTVASFTSNAIQLYGHVVPGSNATFDLGASNMRWRDLYLTGNTIDLDGIRISVEGTSLKVADTNGNLVQILASNVSAGEISSGTYSSNAVLLNGQASTFYTNASNINAGTLAVAFGGTGSTNLTSSKLLVGNGSNVILTPSDLHWTGANLGIGSTTPFAKLDVSGTVRATSVTVTSTALASNLNADLLDGQQGSFYQNGNNITAGTVGVAYGGTGATTLAANKLMVGNGTNAVLTPTNLHWDNTNSRLGLGGVTAPDTSLHAKGVLKVESGGGNATAPKLYFISEYEPSAGQYWWKLANITLQNGNLFEVDGNFSRVDGATGYVLSVLGTNNNANSNLQIYCEVTRPSATVQSAFEIYRDTSVSPNKADIYIRTLDYVWASMRVQTHGTVYPVSWGSTAPVTSASYYKIFDSGFASNCTMVKTQNRQIGIGTQPRTGYSIDAEGNIAGAGFFGNGGGLTSINIGNVGIGTLAVAYGGTGTNTLTANKILVGNGTSALTAPSDLHWSGANLGIGSTTPGTKLDVAGTVRATSVLVSSTELASNLNADLLDGQHGVYYQNATNINAGTLAVAYGGTGTSSLSSSKLLVGNGLGAVSAPSDLHWSGAYLGIGSTNPVTKLDVIGTIRATSMVVSSTGLASNLNADLLDGQHGTYYQNATNINAGTLGIAYGGTGTTSLTTSKLLVGNGTSAVSTPTDLHWSGANLGIGSTTPVTKLDVSGTVQANAIFVTSTALASNLNADLLDGQQGSYYQNATNINTGTLAVAYGGTGTNTFTANRLLVGNTTSAISSASDLTWNGANLGIGTTMPSYKLDVLGSINASSQIVSSVASGTAPLSVTSTTLVTNFNADLLDGQHGTYYQNATNINAGTLGVAYGGTGTNTLTASKIIVGNGASAVSTPTALHWDGTNTRLGINNVTPSDRLHVSGGLVVESTSANPLKIVSQNDASGAPFLYVLAKRSDTNAAFNFSGKIGLAKHYTSGAVQSDSVLGTVAFGGNHTNSGESNVAFSGAIHGVSDTSFTSSSGMGCAITFRTGSDGTTLATNNVSIGTERMRITSAGRVGIGTATPGYLLDVNGITKTSMLVLSSNVPLAVPSGAGITTNLNADLLDGQHGAYYQDATNINAGTLGVSRGGTGTNTLTANKLLVGNGTSVVAAPTDLHWTGANLGIGSTNPVTKLDVSGIVQATAIAVSSTGLVANLNADLLDGQQGAYYQNATNINTGTLGVAYGGTGSTSLTANKLLIGNGTSAVSAPTDLHWTGANLGIGSTTPVAKLDVGGTIQATAMTLTSNYSMVSKGITVNGTANIKNLVALNDRAPLATVNRVVSTWTARAGIVSNTWRAVCWSPDISLFVAVGDGTTKVMTSSDGITWTARTAAAANAWQDVCWSPELSLFVAVSSSGVGNRVMTSPDGVTWTSRTSAADKDWRGVTWSTELSLFVAVAYDYNPAYVMKSTDGITWTLAATVTGGYWCDVCWSPDLSLFVAVNGSTNFLSSQVLTSSDGNTWTERSAPVSGFVQGVCWSPELSLFVGVCSTGTYRVITSPNGIDWTQQTAAAAVPWQDVCWSPELSVFVAVGSSSAITTHVMTSRDGIIWTARTTPGNLDLTSICWSPQLSMFVGLVGIDSGGGIVITSEVGLPDARSTLLVNPSYLTATSAGRIGINQISPSYTLHVNGSIGCGNIDMPSSTLTATGGSVIANILRPKGPFYGGTSAYISHNDNVGSDLRIEFVVGGTPYAQAYGYITNAGLGTKQLNFTGQHKVFHNFTGSNLGSYSGLIVSSTGHYRLLDHTTRPTINEALPVVKLANTPYDPTCFGVVSGIEDKDSYEFSTGHFVSVVEKQDSTDIPLIVNAVGEGSLWVCDINGPISNGDYLTTSSVPGYAMRQGSDANKSYTVAKCTCDCSFDDTMVHVQEVKMKTITYEEEDFVYEDVSTEQEQTYFDEALQKLIRKKFVTVKKQHVTEPTPVYDEQLNVVGIQDAPVKRVCTKTKKVADLSEDGELQFADVLDDNGNVKMAPRFDIRYLDQNGRLIDKATYDYRKSNGLPAYKAAFVGCMYSFV